MDLLKAYASNRVRFSKEALSVRAGRAFYLKERFVDFPAGCSPQVFARAYWPSFSY
jgi:hypothetical protein